MPKALLGKNHKRHTTKHVSGAKMCNFTLSFFISFTL